MGWKFLFYTSNKTTALILQIMAKKTFIKGTLDFTFKYILKYYLKATFSIEYEPDACINFTASNLEVSKYDMKKS
jgi:hypothetical protein